MPRRTDSTAEKVLVVILDLLAFFIAANLAYDLRYYIDWRSLVGDVIKEGPAPWGALYKAMPYMLLGWFVIFATFGLYRTGLRQREEISQLIKAQLTGFTILYATAFFYRGFSYSRGAALFLVPLALLFTLGFRHLFRLFREQLLKMRGICERVVIVGRSAETERLIQKLKLREHPYELVGVLVREEQEVAEGIQRLGTPAELGKLLTRNPIDRVLLISGDLDQKELTQAIDTCYRHRTGWAVVPDLYDLLVDRLYLDYVAGVPVMGPAGSRIVGMNLAMKRALDFLAALFLVLVLSPLMAVVALLIKVTSKGPVLFVQKRVGRGERSFDLYKFRSMYAECRDKKHRDAMEKVIKSGEACSQDNGKRVYKMKDDPRVTPVGRFIRRFSLDELPQLFNVIKGDMSLVGPRPAIPYEVKMYGERDRRRLETLPGITGLWQVSGRNRLSFEEMVDLDIHYIENWSMGLDIRICFKTIATVFLSKGY